MRKSKKSIKNKRSTYSSRKIIASKASKIIAPTIEEKAMALKTLMMLYQNSSFSKDESRVFNSFLERFSSSNMKKEDLYQFLSTNPSIRRKIWETPLL